MLWPLLTCPASRHASLLLIVHQVHPMPRARTGTVSFLSHVIGQSKSHGSIKVMRQEGIHDLQCVCGGALKSTWQRAWIQGGLKDGVNNPTYHTRWCANLCGFVFFWFLTFSVPSHKDFEVVDIFTFLLSDGWWDSTSVTRLTTVPDAAMHFSWEKYILA